MKVKIGKNYITRFYKMVPECEQKAWVCRHETCLLWEAGYRVHMNQLLGVKFLLWEQPTVGDYPRFQEPKPSKPTIQSILPRLHAIRASIPLTYGKNARRLMKELIEELEEK